MGKVKKSKFRKCINRLKNFLRYARKRCSIHVLPVVCGCSVVLVTLFTSYQNTYATGLEEAFYYTYLDLMSGLYAQTGYELSFKDEYYTKPERASAKDVWDNFCTWVERKAQVLSLPVRIVNDTVFNELQNLPNVVTQAGATMSEDLSELLATVLPATAYDDMVNQFDTSSIESINKVVSNLTGGGYLSSTQAKAIMNGEALLNIVYDPSNGRYMAYALSLTYGIVDDYKIGDPREDFLSLFVIDSTGNSKFCSIYGSVIRGSKTTTDMSCYTAKPDMVWVVKNGAFTGVDGTSLNDYAKVKQVDDNTIYVPGVGYKTNWDIWKDTLNDRTTTDAEEEAWNSRYNFENDNDNEKKEKKKTPAKVKVDKSELESYIDSYGSVAADGYTEDSYQAYSSALENAKSVDADEDATQSQVDQAKGNLYTAYNGLVEAFNPANYSWPAYRDVARNPDSYSGQKLAFKGKVLQVVEGDSETDLRIATDGGYDDVIFVGFDPSIMGGTRVLEDDTVTIYGTCVGQYSYQSTMGAKISLPGLYADQVEINQ